MPLAPFDPTKGQTIRSNVAGCPSLTMAYDVRWTKTPIAAATTTLLAATASAAGLNQAPTTTVLDVCRNVTATTTGTGGNVLAVQVVVTGTDLSGAVITETLPAFSAGSLTTVTGSKAFATVTNITVPATGASTNVAIGVGSKLGLHHKLPHNSVVFAFLNNVREGTAPTVAFDSANLSGNTATLNSAIPGSQVIDIYYRVTS
jgi:hypothetical protein